MTWQVRGVRTGLVGLLVMGAAQCSNPASAPPTTPAAKPPVAVSAATVVAADWQESVEVVGTLAPKFSADIKSEVTGTVSEVFVTEWVPVHKGDKLARLDSRETEAGIEALKAAVAQAVVAQTRAKREYERAQQLKQYGLITPQAFDDAKSAVDAADAAVVAANAQVKTGESRLTKLLITSPMDGVVAMRGVSAGDRVENMGSSDPLFRIVDNRVLDLTVSVPSSRLSRVRVGQPLEFSTDSLPGRTFTGHVSFVNPTIDAASRAAKVTAAVANSDGSLRGGAFVKGRIIVASRPKVLQLPREALLNWDADRRTADVIVVHGDQPEKKSITLGADSGATIEVASGLQAGDVVVTRGAYAIGQGDRVTVVKGEGA